ncbi:MAG: hypothetical protein ACRD88_04975, partial [Terriglobia bacterium]
NPDAVLDPKGALIGAARRSRSAEVRSRIVPRHGSTARQGPEYNNCLEDFVSQAWNVEVATKCSPSLRRAVDRLATFEPSWTTA